MRSLLIEYTKYASFLANFYTLINLRKQAKDLLERAKRSVEIAIEQDEQTAIDWLESVSQVTDA
jgi:hypothetical protein